MEGFLYDDDLENDQKNVRRLAIIEESINKTLLYDGEKNNLSLKNSSSCLICICAGSVIIVIIIVLILVLKRLT